MFKITNGRIEECNVWDLIDWLETVSEVGLDIETEGLVYLKHKIVGISLGNYDTQFVIPLRTTDKAQITMIVCELQSKKIVGHNLLFDLSFIEYYMRCNVGMWDVFDTYQIETILSKGMKSEKGYAALVKMYCNTSVSKELQKTFKYDEDFTTDQIMYMADDVKYLIPIKETQEKHIEKYIEEGYGTKRLFQLETELTPILSSIQVGGCNYDVELHRENTRKIENLVERDKYYLITFLKRIFNKYELNKVQYSKDFEVLTKEDVENINFNSPSQLLTLIHQIDNSVINTREDTLNKYLLTGKNEDLKSFIKLLISHRHRNKLLTTYGESFLSAVVQEGDLNIIRTNLQQNVSATGRLISSDVNEKSGKKHGKNFVNLQNFPQDQSFRSCFIPRPGYNMGTLDFGAAELRVLTSQSKDPFLMEGMLGKSDFHSILATQSFRIISDDETLNVSSKENGWFRTKHKRVLFGIIYGAGPSRIADVLNIPKKLANSVFKAIVSKIQVAFDYLESCADLALKQNVGIANNITRRFIILDELEQHKKMRVYYPVISRIRRQMFNFNMQATNADMIKQCIINVFRYFNSIKEYGCKILFTVYDEMVFEYPQELPEIADKVKQICIETCNEFLSEGIKMECNIVTGPHWVK